MHTYVNYFMVIFLLLPTGSIAMEEHSPFDQLPFELKLTIAEYLGSDVNSYLRSNNENAQMLPYFSVKSPAAQLLLKKVYKNPQQPLGKPAQQLLLKMYHNRELESQDKGFIWALLYSTPSTMCVLQSLEEEKKNVFFARGVATLLNRYNYSSIPKWVPKKMHTAIHFFQEIDQTLFDAAGKAEIDIAKKMLSLDVDIHKHSNKIRCMDFIAGRSVISFEMLMSPIVIATIRGHTESVALLLEHGADVDDLFVKCFTGQCMYDRVKEKKQTELIAVIDNHILQQKK